uniref:Ion_trans_2 domain-containing protein n=1 Tax=Meloidogyne hapla TaxID=6305 RepID=A0A1I8BUE5_MELHA
MAMVSRRRDTFFINPPMEKPRRNTNIKPPQPPPILQTTTAESFDMDESSDGETAAVTEPVGGIEVLQIPTQSSYEMEGSLTKSEKMFKYIRFIGPHVGLVLLLVVYLLIGATIFTRDKEMRELLALRDHFHDTIWNLTQSDESVISQDSFYGIGREYFDKLVLRTFEACRNQFTNERHLLNKTRETTELLWTYTNSLFFATTVITTIGYGNLVPMTRLGRVACICFALFGIPLLATMCIDLAGTEYIRKIHYLGSKMEDAKGTVITGLRAGEYILKHRGIEVIRTASGKLIQVGGAMLSLKQARELGVSYVLSELDLDSKNSKNKLYDPPSAAVQRLLKGKNIKVNLEVNNK